jgi:3-hydroxymyristoyl/3-hydroxydecanoyl-(acyl carrier protein) dehydratase
MNKILKDILYPELLKTEFNNSILTLNFVLQDDLSYLDGHFTHTAILPGVVQLHWAVHYVKQFFMSTDAGNILRTRGTFCRGPLSFGASVEM